MDLVAQLSAGIVSGVLFFSALQKMRSFPNTQAALKAWHLPSSLYAVYALCGIEIFTSVYIIINPTIGSIVAGTLLMLFTVVELIALARKVEAPCPCFGAVDETLSIKSIIRNAVLLALCVLAQPAEINSDGLLTRGLAAFATLFATQAFMAREPKAAKKPKRR